MNNCKKCEDQGVVYTVNPYNYNSIEVPCVCTYGEADYSGSYPVICEECKGPMPQDHSTIKDFNNGTVTSCPNCETTYAPAGEDTHVDCPACLGKGGFHAGTRGINYADSYMEDCPHCDGDKTVTKWRSEEICQELLIDLS